MECFEGKGSLLQTGKLTNDIVQHESFQSMIMKVYGILLDPSMIYYGLIVHVMAEY
jgi:hypothetical protein